MRSILQEKYMKARGLVLLGVSGLLGFLAIAWVQKPVASSDTVKVVIAKVALDFGDRLVPEKLQIVDYPPGSVPPGAFERIEQLAGPGEDRVVLRSIDPQEPVLASKVSGSGGRAILSTVIDKGMRAVTISVNDVKGVAGFVQPGDRVDVLLTRSAGSNAGDEQRNDVLLQNIKVLGVDQQADDKKDKPIVAKAVTLEVSPDDGQKLTLASSIGSLSLALRNFSNPESLPTRSLSSNDLVPEQPKAVVATPVVATPVVARAAHPAGSKVEILRGTDSTIYDVKNDGRVAMATGSRKR
jgi:pilus assembly protein CpaB